MTFLWDILDELRPRKLARLRPCFLVNFPSCKCFFPLNSGLLTYSSVRKLVKLSAVQFMLNNHTVSSRLEPPTMRLGEL